MEENTVVTNRETPDEPQSAEFPPAEEHPKRQNISPVLKFRLFVCILAAAAALLIKAMGGDVYEKTVREYKRHTENSIVTEIGGKAQGYDITRGTDKDTH